MSISFLAGTLFNRLKILPLLREGDFDKGKDGRVLKPINE